MPTPSLTSSPLPPAAKPPQKSWRKRFKRLGISALGLLAILIIVFLLLPQWISNDQGRMYVLERWNGRMKAKVSVGGWSLSWFRGTDLRDVKLTLPDGSVLFSSPHIKSELTLWGILWGKYDLGTTTVEAPKLQLTKGANGTLSADALSMGGTHWPLSHRVLGTLRGSLQFSKGSVTLTSVRANDSIAYSDVSGVCSIASPDAPLHVQVTGVAPDRSVSINASCPAARFWTKENWPQVVAGSDLEVSATRVPTGVACDWLGLDGRWVDSFGKELNRVSVSNHANPPMEGTVLSVQITGERPDQYVDALLQAKSANLRGPAVVSIPETGELPYRATASLGMSAPLAHLLREINPLFGQVEGTTQAGTEGETGGGTRGDVVVTATDLRVNSKRPEESQFSGRLNLPSLKFAKGGLLGQLLPRAKRMEMTATVNPLRFRFRDGKISYEHLAFYFEGRQRVIFQGSVAPEGAVNLMATVPDDGAGGGDSLQTVTADLPVTGTVEAPVVNLPK